MDAELLMAFEHYQIVSVALMIAEEQILAVGRIYFLPVFKSKLYCRQRRVCVVLVFYAIVLEECQYFADPIVHVV